jgi:hypothetical protein
MAIELKEQPFFAISSDGWKKSTAGSGVGLVNFNVLLKDGGSQFHKVRSFSNGSTSY